MAGRSTTAKSSPLTPPDSLTLVRRVLRRHPEWEAIPCRICTEWCIKDDEYADAHPYCVGAPLEMRPPEDKKKRTRKKDPLQSESMF